MHGALIDTVDLSLYLLRLYGTDLTDRPFSERWSLLERLDLHGPRMDDLGDVR